MAENRLGRVNVEADRRTRVNGLSDRFRLRRIKVVKGAVGYILPCRPIARRLPRLATPADSAKPRAAPTSRLDGRDTTRRATTPPPPASPHRGTP